MRLKKQKFKVLLLVPVTGKFLPFFRTAYLPHTGLAYLAAYLRKKNIDVKIFDGELQPKFKKLKKLIVTFQPDFIGLSVYTYQQKAAAKTAQKIKKEFPKIKIIIGGAQVTCEPSKTLKNCAAYDYGLLGEGEEAFYKLLTAVNQKKFRPRIKGLVYRCNKEIVIIPGQYNLAVDSLPFPAWDLFPLEQYRNIPYYHQCLSAREFISVHTGRGCPFQCAFCFHTTGYRARLRSIHNLIQELNWLRRNYPVKYINFTDDTFCLNKKRLIQLCEYFLRNRQPKPIAWRCNTRVDTLDENLLDLMQQAGCNSIFLGLESGSQRILDSINKGYVLSEYKDVFKLIKQKKITLVASFIIGLPGEKISDFIKTVKLALSIPLDVAFFLPFIPLPKTPLYQRRSKSLINFFYVRLKLLIIYFLFYLRPRQLLKIIAYLGFGTKKTFQLSPKE